MRSLDFKNCTVYMTARSPFARRVRLAFYESGVDFEEKSIEVFHPPNAELAKLNPLARIPTVVLRSGEVLIDSNQILQAFYPAAEFDPLVSRWSAIGVGLAEKTIEYFLEMLRSEERRDPEVLHEFKTVLDWCLKDFEDFIADREIISPKGLSQVDWDMGSALGYLDFRYSKEWHERYPKSAAYLSRLEKRPSFQRTMPKLG